MPLRGTALNKYSRWYDALISKAKDRDPLIGYCEKHHVIPRCMGGSNEKSNIVALTYREHFIAHWLLSKFTTGQTQRKMLHAIGMMAGSVGGRTVAAWQYEKAKTARAVAMVGNDYNLGNKPTDETRSKISASLTGRKLSSETRAKMFGRKHTVEARANMSAALVGNKYSLGHKHTDEARAKMSASRVGKKHTDETKAKMSEWQVGRTLTDKHRANLSAAKVGKKLSDEQRAARVGYKHADETRANMSAAHIGIKHTDETRAKVSAAKFAYWAARRAVTAIIAANDNSSEFAMAA